MWTYVFLGIIQGIFEWFPISSEGIVALSSQFLVKNINPIDIALFLHLGTVFAVLIYFRKDWKEVFMLRNYKLLRFLIISTLVSLVIGYPLYNVVKNVIIGNSLLLIMGFGLLLTAYFHKTKRGFKTDFNKLAIITGFLQGLAVVPGLSRSGSTIFGLSLGESKPSEVLKVSYIMSVPVILVSSVYLFLKNPVFLVEGWPALISSFLIGIFSLHFLIKLAQKINFFKFALIFSFLCFLGAVIGFIV
ncbi:MAG: undecaprenyl-diphosphate phosphatase [Candidatus Nealsonbacteria bacterium]|nr:MAG: undecaprenyl-diphosphate phosphatase [Candidatus Nealsonbacteria bacterium]